MEIFRAAEILPETFRTQNSAVVAFDQAAVGLARKKELSGTEDDQGKNATKQDGEDKRRTNGNENFIEKSFHGFLSYAR